MTTDEPDASEPAAAESRAIREPPRVLVPVEVLEGEAIAPPLAAFLSPSEIVVLGYHVLPDQTSTEQASLQFEDRAQAAVEDIAATFRNAGRDVETRVAFTHDRDQTVDRVAADVGATAVLYPNPSGDISDVLVPIRGVVDTDRLADLLAELLVGGDGTVTLWGVTKPDSGFDAEAAVQDVRERLLDAGMRADRMLADATSSGAPVREIIERSADYDIVVMGEGEESVFATLFGDPEERVAGGAVAPVLVVRAREIEA